MIISYAGFRGFRSVETYEKECEKVGMRTERIPCLNQSGDECFALITHCPEPCSMDARNGIDIFPADGSRCLFSGTIHHDGSDLETVLIGLGYSLIGTVQDDPGSDLVQLSLFA